MNEKTINDNPTTGDRVLFELNTPSGSSSNPYEVVKVTIYFVSRDYASENVRKYEGTESDLEGRSLNEFYFKEAEPVHIVGNEDYPAWLSTDSGNSLLENIEDCLFKYVWEPKGAREGDYFICWTWRPLPAGDTVSSHLKFYLKGDTSLTTSLPIHRTNPKKYISLLEKYLPETFKDRLSNSDVTPEVLNKLNKSIASGFETLEDLANQIVDLHDANCVNEFFLPYLSNFFGHKLKTDDPTRWRGQIKRAIPLYKKKGTKAGLSEALEHIGTVLENFSQLWQVVSSRTWQEVFRFDGLNRSFVLEKQPLIPISEYLTNFSLQIRYRESSDWIDLDESYIELEVGDEESKIKWIGDEYLTNPITIRKGDEIRITYQYAELNEANQSIENYIRNLPLMDTRDNKSFVRCETTEGSNVISGLPINSEFRVGQTLYSQDFEDEIEVIEIISNSKIRVSLNSTSNNDESLIAFYNFEYPPKNWNTRVIREDDPMFETIVPSRNPFFDQLIFGKVRTEFPYSENIYHMEEYNGSIRDSKNPCDIDKSFIDPCYSCASSSYDIDVEIEDLSDDKIKEVRNTLEENLPFHAIMHTCNFIGGFNEFIAPPQEELEILMSYFGSDFVVAGNAQSYFSRVMLNFMTDGLKRSELAEDQLVASGSGTCFNDEILVFCPGVVLSSVGVNSSGNCFIEIKSPSPLSGSYTVKPSQGDAIKLVEPSLIEPISVVDSPFEGGTLNTSAFTFDLNTTIKPLDGSLYNIEQRAIYKIRDTEYDINTLNIKTLKDVENERADYAWKVSVPVLDGEFFIKDIENGYLVFEHDEAIEIPAGEATIDWSIFDDTTEILYSSNGKISLEKIGKVTSLNPSTHPIKNILNSREYYQTINNIEYKVSGIVDGSNDQYYLQDYDQGNASGGTISIKQKLVSNKIGYLTYRGINLDSSVTEESLGIQNGSSYSGEDLIDNNLFKENFIVVINDIPYWIQDIENGLIKLSGKPQYFTTNGTPDVNFEIYKYIKKENIFVQGQKGYFPDYTFPKIDRDGKSIIISDILDRESGLNTITGLSKNDENDEVKDVVSQQEEVSFKVEYKEVNKNE